MSICIPTRGEILTALVIYRALQGSGTAPPRIADIAAPEQAKHYVAEAESGLAALERGRNLPEYGGERPWTEDELNALPDYSLVGVNAGPVGENWGVPRYEVFQKYGREWQHLDPSDREDGERLDPSRYLIHLSSRYGQTKPRIRALYIPVSPTEGTV